MEPIGGSSFLAPVSDEAIAPITAGLAFVPWRPTDGMLTSWITPKAKHWLTQPGRRLGLRIDTPTRPPSRGIRLLSIRSLSALLSAGYYHEYYGIYFSHPFSHQGLIDFILSLPDESAHASGREPIPHAARYPRPVAGR